MSVSSREFKKQIKENKELCFCGERLKVGRDGERYCPKCNLVQGDIVGWVTYLNGCTEVIRGE